MQSDQKTAGHVTGAQLQSPRFVQMYIAQLIVLLTVSALLVFHNSVVAYSALVGGLISVVPNAYFARWAFRYSGARSAGQVASSFYRGEAGKFVFTALMFAAVFAWLRPLEVVALFLMYIFMMALNWILALRLLSR